MKVYDIVLAFIRGIIALDIIREIVSLGYELVRGFLVVTAAGGTNYIKVVEGTTMLSPIIGLVVSVAILGNAKRLARFAAKLAAEHDTAVQF